MSCIWTASDRPRALRDRHEDECTGEDCKGCEPCPWSHCRACGKEHAEHTCPTCLADARETLTAITVMCASLPAEVAHRGVDSEAMNLLGPVADPEAIGHMRASVNVGRIPADWLEDADHELHPLLVLGTWMEAYIEAFDHSDPARITVVSAASYLDRNLVYMSTFADVPFEDFARNLRQCRTHMERVLHDGEQVETGAPCMTCRVPLRLVRTEGEDHWSCPKCRQESNDDQYRFAIKADFIENSPELNADDMAVRVGISSSTIRKWANVMRVQVKGEEAEELPAILKPSGRVGGRKVYRVEDVEEIIDNGGDGRRSEWATRTALPA